MLLTQIKMPIKPTQYIFKNVQGRCFRINGFIRLNHRSRYFSLALWLNLFLKIMLVLNILVIFILK